MRYIILLISLIILFSQPAARTKESKYGQAFCVKDGNAGYIILEVNKDKWTYVLDFLYGYDTTRLIYLTGQTIEIDIDVIDKNWSKMDDTECFEKVLEGLEHQRPGRGN